MRKRNQPLGPKVYRVLIASEKGDAIVEATACNADSAKTAVDRQYRKDGWMVMSARYHKCKA